MEANVVRYSRQAVFYLYRSL